VTGHADDHAALPPAAPEGLLGQLMAVVRPEFRADVLSFDAEDPVFGGPVCRVTGCRRPAHSRGMCLGHEGRWRHSGCPDPERFAATTALRLAGEITSCQAPGCGYGVAGMGLCDRHYARWKARGRPELTGWLATVPATRPPAPLPLCQVTACQIWAQPRETLCRVHHRRWIRDGRPGRADWLSLFASLRDGLPVHEHIDLRNLPAALKLELQYVLQCRRDDETIKVKARDVRGVVAFLRAGQFISILDTGNTSAPVRDSAPRAPGAAAPAKSHRAFLAYAWTRLADLLEGRGWDAEYGHDTWQLRRLGIGGTRAFTFGKIGQSWLKDLAKRWIRSRLAIGQSPEYVRTGTIAITRFSGFLDRAGVRSLGQVDRPLLERYLADLHQDLAGRAAHHKHISQLSTFLEAIRRYRWDDTLPASAVFHPEDYPAQGIRLPRYLSGHVMSQLEDQANLSRWDNPAHQLITVILMRCGLRISSAVTLAFDCVIRDAEGAPYLKYFNTKMKRQALVPIDEQLAEQIRHQQQRVTARWPAGLPILFPRPTGNITGRSTLSSSTYRDALRRWLARCDIRDEHNRPVTLTPHQWRHTLGTALINKDVPQHIVQKILDHDSAEMTSHYARLHDTTVREHWERARKVNNQGQSVTLDPGGPLAQAAWAKQRIGRATQALPNGYCGLPVQQSCPHANACLTCPMFLTTADFLPHHKAHHQQLLQIITIADADGRTRVAEMNRQVAGNLEKIITALEGDSTQPRARDAS
jgi:integrase